jgi:hypothetical protein
LKRRLLRAELMPEVGNGTHVRILPNPYSKSTQKQS